MAKRKRYGKEFKVGAARLVVEQGYTRAEAAERLGVSAWSLGRWIEGFRKSGELPPEGQPVAKAEQMKELRRENKRLRLENEILKKAAAYFAKESL